MGSPINFIFVIMYFKLLNCNVYLIRQRVVNVAVIRSKSGQKPPVHVIARRKFQLHTIHCPNSRCQQQLCFYEQTWEEVPRWTFAKQVNKALHSQNGSWEKGNCKSAYRRWAERSVLFFSRCITSLCIRQGKVDTRTVSMLLFWYLWGWRMWELIGNSVSGATKKWSEVMCRLSFMNILLKATMSMEVT